VTRTRTPIIRYETAPSLFVWGDERQADLIADVADRSGLRLAGVGGPDPSEAARLADRLGAARMRDVREFVGAADQQGGLLLLASRSRLEEGDRRALRRARGSIVSLEPYDPIDESRETHDAPTVHFAPLFRSSAGFTAAMSALPLFGTPRCVSITMHGEVTGGSLRARVFDAMLVAAEFCGECESIDAGMQGGAGQAGSVAGGEALTAHLRFPPGRSAVVVACTNARSWRREVTLLNDQGDRLLIHDEGVKWDGVDAASPARGDGSTSASCAAAIARALQRTLDRLDSLLLDSLYRRAWSMCDAAALSARTGQCESPARLLHLLDRV
jgi:hypothetical protein